MTKIHTNEQNLNLWGRGGALKIVCNLEDNSINHQVMGFNYKTLIKLKMDTTEWTKLD